MTMWDYETFIFDLYGTLINIRTDEHSAATWKKWGRWLDRHEIKHPHYIEFRRDFFGKDKEYRLKAVEKGPYKNPEIDVLDIYRELFSKYGNENLTDQAIEEASYAFREASRSCIGLYPGVEDFLKALRLNKKNIYILSNAQRSYTWPEIKVFCLDELTDDQLISSDYKCMKPEKAFFEFLFEKENVDRSRAVMIGDSRWSDIEGAIGAGVAYIHLEGENRADLFYTREVKNMPK